MRVWGAIGLMATNVAATSAATMSSSVAVQSDLFYATSASCASLNALPTDRDLSAALLPTENFHGIAKLTKTDAPSPLTGCVLHLNVHGELPNRKDKDAAETAGGAFAVTSYVDESLVKMATAHVLRGSEGLKDLTLQRLQVKLGDHREYSIDTQATSGETTTGELSLIGTNCGDFATTKFLADLLPTGAEGVAIVPGDGDKTAAECVVSLNALARVPPFSSTSDAAALLKSLDDSLNDWFGASSTKRSSASLASARVAFSPALKSTAEKTVPEAAAMATTLAATDRLNAPTKQITLGILFGITVLCAMLFGITYQKKRHEQSMQTRHANASRVAQIRRVSYKMGYEPVHGHDTTYDASHRHQFGAEEEEKDGLL